MLTPEKIKDLQAQAHEAIASERDAEREKHEKTSLAWLLTQMPAWKRWYLKKNQPQNYLRVTRIIPTGAEENRYRWMQKIQCWVRGTIEFEYNIDHDTYDYFAAQWGEKKTMRDMEYYTYRTPGQLETIRQAADKTH